MNTTYTELILRCWQDGGWLMIPLAMLSFSIWALFLRSRNHMLHALKLPPQLSLQYLSTGDRLTYDEIALSTQQRLKRDIHLLSALTASAPLTGLLGTVAGMIHTFHALAATTAGTQAGTVSDGISQALITTQFGLVIALPGVFGVARLRRLLRQVQTAFSCTHDQEKTA